MSSTAGTTRVNWTSPPDGFSYYADVLRASEHDELLAAVARLEFEAVQMRGATAARTVVHYGLRYGYDSHRVEPAEPLPSFLELAARRAARLLDVAPEAFAECLVTRYPAGAGIGWHRDAPMFGALVGVSLGSVCPFQLRRRRSDGTFERGVVLLEPRSAYVIEGSARWQWQHRIAATPAERYSVTFRTLRPPKPER